MRKRGWYVLLFVAMPLLVAAAGFDGLTVADAPVRNGHFYYVRQVALGTGFRITNDGAALIWQGYEQEGGLAALGPPISRRFICGSDLCQATEGALLRWSAGDKKVLRVSIRRELMWLGHLEDLPQLPDGILARRFGYIPPAALIPEQLSDAQLPDMPAFSRTAEAVAAAALPSVVKIEVGHDDFGSGVIFDTRGYVLTNQHVVASSEKVKVVMSNGRRVDATVVGSDAAFDVALVKMADDDLPAIAIGNSSLVGEGDEIVVIGYTPLLDRSPSPRTGTVRFAGQMHGHIPAPSVIQTDAFVHPGDSGGPLLNMRGELIGLIDSITAVRSSPHALRSNALAISSVKVVADRLLTESSYSP